RSRDGGDTTLRLQAERIELIEIGAGVELRVLDACNHQRRDGEIRIRAERRVREAADEPLVHERTSDGAKQMDKIGNRLKDNANPAGRYGSYRRASASRSSRSNDPMTRSAVPSSVAS